MCTVHLDVNLKCICYKENRFIYWCLCIVVWNRQSSTKEPLIKRPPVSPPQVRGWPCSRFWTSTRTISWTLMEPETPLWEVGGWKLSRAQLDSCVHSQLTFDTCKVGSVVMSPGYMSVTFSLLLFALCELIVASHLKKKKEKRERWGRERERETRSHHSFPVATVPAVPLLFSPALISTWFTFETCSS